MIGANIHEQPRTTRMLKIFEPTTLPIDNSLLPLKADEIDTDASGKLVPMIILLR